MPTLNVVVMWAPFNIVQMGALYSQLVSTAALTQEQVAHEIDPVLVGRTIYYLITPLCEDHFHEIDTFGRENI
jgi:hypothetical protein